MTMREKRSTNGLKRKVLAGSLLVVLAFRGVSCAKESGEISDADQIVTESSWQRDTESFQRASCWFTS